MIKNKTDLYRYLEMDAKALGINPKRFHFFGKEIWRFEKALRKYEYYHNCTRYNPMKWYWYMIYRYLSFKLGFVIPPNVFAGGVRINHYGNIVINPGAQIGEWCDIHQGVNIGTGMDGGVPILGDNVWIGPGAKIYGGIRVADGCAIGANAVVNKSFPEEHCTIAGVPAKIVSKKGNRYVRSMANSI